MFVNAINVTTSPAIGQSTSRTRMVKRESKIICVSRIPKLAAMFYHFKLFARFFQLCVDCSTAIIVTILLGQWMTVNYHGFIQLLTDFPTVQETYFRHIKQATTLFQLYIPETDISKWSIINTYRNCVTANVLFNIATCRQKTPSALDVTLKQNPVYRLLTLSFTAISFNFFSFIVTFARHRCCYRNENLLMIFLVWSLRRLRGLVIIFHLQVTRWVLWICYRSYWMSQTFVNLWV